MSEAKQIQNVTSVMLSGTGQDIIRLLRRSPQQRTVAITFADDERPQDVLATDPESVIAAAKDEVAELQHGYPERGYRLCRDIGRPVQVFDREVDGMCR